MDLNNQLQEMDALVKEGAIPTAVENYFADNATTSDFSGATTSTKQEMLQKMESFLDGIAKVNGITLHRNFIDGNVSVSEYTFDFLMKDNSDILWHEIIKRTWNSNGKVTQEEYFNS